MPREHEEGTQEDLRARLTLAPAAETLAGPSSHSQLLELIVQIAPAVGQSRTGAPGADEPNHRPPVAWPFCHRAL
jgi:hypothetical protein